MIAYKIQTVRILMLIGLLAALGYVVVPLYADLSKHRAKAQVAIENVNRYLSKNGYDRQFGFDALNIESIDSDVIYDFEKVEFGNVKSDCEITVDKETAAIISFEDGKYFQNELIPQIGPPQKTMAEEEVIRLAKEFLIAATDVNFDRLGEPYVNFSYDGGYRNEYYEGYWLVRFPRYSAGGYEFRRDHATAIIYDKYGPGSAGRYFHSKFEEPEFEPIALETAVKRAHESLPRMRYHKPYQGRLVRLEPKAKPKGSKLQIVNPFPPTHLSNPNYILLPVGGLLDARLAWILQFEGTIPPSSDSKENTEPAPSGTFEVWIDAENGAFLGGDYM